jgi:hypothetical protein
MGFGALLHYDCFLNLLFVKHLLCGYLRFLDVMCKKCSACMPHVHRDREGEREKVVLSEINTVGNTTQHKAMIQYL